MKDKKASDAALIAQYRVDAAARRRLSGTKSAATALLAVQAKNGVITVHFGKDAKPVSALGGVAKVLGRSRIDIPEFKPRRG
jgi:ribosomal protein S12